MFCLTLGKVDKNIIPIIIGCIFSFLSRLISKLQNTELFKHAIIINLLTSIAKLFTAIPIIINKVKSKKIHRDQVAFQNLELIYTDINYEIVKGKGRYIILTSVIYFIQGIIVVCTIKIKTKNTWIWDILFTSLLYY